MKKIILGALVLSTTLTFAQKKNTTNAAMAYRDAKKSIAEGKVERAATELLEAKKYIDMSSTHEDTKTDAKTLMYKGKIYLEVGMVGTMAKNETVMAMDIDKLAEDGVNSLKSVKANDKKDRYGDDVITYCDQLRRQGYNVGIKMYQDKKYEEAMAGFSMSATFSEVLGNVDSAAYFYAGLSALNIEKWDVVEENFEKCVEIGYRAGTSVSCLNEAYTKLDKKDKAEKMLQEQVVKHPGNKEIMIALINVYLGQGKKVEAENVLTDALALDPDSRDLNYAVATVYSDLDRLDDAENAYKKVIEIDPNYIDALYGLGVVYFNKSAILNAKINDLTPGDPQEEVLRASMKENFVSSLPYFEKANELNPNNKEILSALKQVYYKTGNIVKFKEVKAQIEAL